jgi:Secretion system C-terminal sorting domain
MVRKLFLFVSLCLISLIQQEVKAQIYNNGSLSTGLVTASGFVAPSGYTWSELQNNTGNTTQVNGTSGLPAYFYSDGSASYALADDFVVPVGQIWEITSFDFFCYQPIYSGSVPPVNQLRIRLHNTDPSISGATPIVGDLTTNVYDATNSDNAFIYRVFHSVIPNPQQPNFSRKVFRVRGNISATLPAGQYWVEFQAHATDNTELFFPPVTIVGSRSVAGANSKINVISSIFPSDVLGWGINNDIGIPNSAPDVALALPFNINGSVLNSEENYFSNNVVLFPNPANEKISISLSSGNLIQNVKIFDANMRVIKEIDSAKSTFFEVDVSDLSAGAYFVKVVDDFDFEKTIKLIHQ